MSHEDELGFKGRTMSYVWTFIVRVKRECIMEHPVGHNGLKISRDQNSSLLGFSSQSDQERTCIKICFCSDVRKFAWKKSWVDKYPGRTLSWHDIISVTPHPQKLSTWTLWDIVLVGHCPGGISSGLPPPPPSEIFNMDIVLVGHHLWDEVLYCRCTRGAQLVLQVLKSLICFGEEIPDLK